MWWGKSVALVVAVCMSVVWGCATKPWSSGAQLTTKMSSNSNSGSDSDRVYFRVLLKNQSMFTEHLDNDKDCFGKSQISYWKLSASFSNADVAKASIWNDDDDSLIFDMLALRDSFQRQLVFNSTYYAQIPTEFPIRIENQDPEFLNPCWELFTGSRLCVCDNGQAPLVGTPTICSACRVGTIGVRGGSTCHSCQAGRFSNSSGSSVCQTCGRGQVSMTGASSCDSCGLGTSPSSDLSQCIDCPSGRFSNLTSFPCTPCDPGRSSVRASTYCFACTAGKFDNRQDCASCPPGFFSANDGAQNCTQCPTGSTTFTLGSSSQSDCVCTDGFFGSNLTCISCPQISAVDCPKNSTFPLLAPGFWMDPNDPVTIFPCLPSEACSRTENGLTVCSSGYSGTRCSQCTFPGYYSYNGKCEPCPERQVGKIVLVLFAVVMFSGIVLRASDPTIGKHYSLGIALTWIQVISMFSSLPVDWPPEILGLYATLSFFNLNIELASPDCALPMSFWSKWFLKLSVPFLFLGCVLIIFALHRLFGYLFPCLPSLFAITPSMIRDWLREPRLSNFPESEDPYRSSRYVFAIVSFFSFTYTAMCSATFSILNCIEAGNGLLVLKDDPSVKCLDRTHYAYVTRVALPFALIYLFMFPVLLALALWRCRDSPRATAWFGSISLPYKPNHNWFEFFGFFRKVVLIFLLLNRVLFQSTLIQTLLGSIFLFIVLTVHHIYTPYQNSRNNQLYFFWVMVSIACLYGAALFSNESIDISAKRALAIPVLIFFSLSCLFTIFSFINERKIIVQTRRAQVYDHVPNVRLSNPDASLRSTGNIKVTSGHEGNGDTAGYGTKETEVRERGLRVITLEDTDPN